MAEIAWACLITRLNRAVIASENPQFDEAEFDQWLRDHPVGYFVRDPDSPFDCRYMSDLVFHEMYIFEHGDEDALFRKILRSSP
jgi:hypothetical protein